MASTFIKSAITVASLLSLGSAQMIPTPTASPPLNAFTTKGCFSSSEPLEDHGPWTFQTNGNCQPICVLLNKPVMGLVNGTNCFCGDLLPAKNTQVDDSNCNTPCDGYDKDMCGGNNFWNVYLTGLNKNQIAYYELSSASATSKASGSKSTSAAVVTVGGGTVVMTFVPTSSSSKSNSGSSPNTAGIAAGAVVGVVVLVGLVVGVLLFLRNRRRRAVEEEYRRQAGVDGFVHGGKMPHTSHSSINDSRLDPEVMMRRQSDGSIADNQDYSRRILKVTNPDGS